MNPKTASASDVQKNFGADHDQALVEPVRVTKYGRETVYLISAAMYHELKQSAAPQHCNFESSRR